MSEVARGRAAAESLLSGLGLRWDHVRAVGELAESAAPGLDDLICAAWLHDVGYAEQVRSTGFHPLDGALWVRVNGYSPSVVSLVAFHTGAQVEAEERGLTEELNDFEPPDPDLLDMMTFLDMTTGPDGSRVEPADRVTEIVGRYPVDDPVHRAVSRSGAELVASAERGRLALSQPTYGVGR